jgi:hypothetical protein
LWIAPSLSRHKLSAMNVTASRLRVVGFKKAGLRETAVLLALAWLVPLLVHLLPWAGERPLGAYLLPMFWTAFVAVYLYGAAMGVVVGLFASAVNLLVTGLPALPLLSVLSLELAVFALVSAWAVRRTPRLLLIAPLAYGVAKLASTGLVIVVPGIAAGAAPGAFLVGSLTAAAAGLVVLAAINAALIRWYPKA